MVDYIWGKAEVTVRTLTCLQIRRYGCKLVASIIPVTLILMLMHACWSNTLVNCDHGIDASSNASHLHRMAYVSLSLKYLPSLHEMSSSPILSV